MSSPDPFDVVFVGFDQFAALAHLFDVEFDVVAREAWFFGFDENVFDQGFSVFGFAAGGPEAAGPAGYCIGWGIYFLVTSILCLVFVGKAKKELEDESRKDNKPFIITIIFGAISENVFYVLAGIFGLIAEGQQGNN